MTLSWQYALRVNGNALTTDRLIPFPTSIIKQVAWNKSSLLLKNILQNTQILQLLIKVIKTESIYKSY